jgi:hypothetical protein
VIAVYPFQSSVNRKVEMGRVLFFHITQPCGIAMLK